MTLTQKPGETTAAYIARLQAQLAAATAPKALTLKVSQQGAVSVYGLGRFPVTLYREQMERLLNHAPAIREFIEENNTALKTKGDAVAA